MKGFRPGGRRKSGAERAEIGGNLPRGHPCHAFQRPKKPGKTGRYAEEIGCEIGKLSDRENRRTGETALGGCRGADRGQPAFLPGGTGRGSLQTGTVRL